MFKNRIYSVMGIVVFLSLVFASFGFAIAIDKGDIVNDSSNETINSTFILKEGKNFVFFDSYMEVKQLIKRNPQVETVSYYDEVSEKSIGYVNVFGGVGREFLIIPGRIYEISVKSEGKLKLE